MKPLGSHLITSLVILVIFSLCGGFIRVLWFPPAFHKQAHIYLLCHNVITICMFLIYTVGQKVFINGGCSKEMYNIYGLVLVSMLLVCIN